MGDSKIATDKEAWFYRVVRDGVFVYYPESAHAKVKENYPSASRIRGYAVYDTAVSSEFAIELCQSATEAKAFVERVKDVDLAAREEREVPEALRDDEVDSADLAEPKGETEGDDKPPTKPKKLGRFQRR